MKKRYLVIVLIVVALSAAWWHSRNEGEIPGQTGENETIVVSEKMEPVPDQSLVEPVSSDVSALLTDEVTSRAESVPVSQDVHVEENLILSEDQVRSEDTVALVEVPETISSGDPAVLRSVSSEDMEEIKEFISPDQEYFSDLGHTVSADPAEEMTKKEEPVSEDMYSSFGVLSKDIPAEEYPVLPEDKTEESGDIVISPKAAEASETISSENLSLSSQDVKEVMEETVPFKDKELPGNVSSDLSVEQSVAPDPVIKEKAEDVPKIPFRVPVANLSCLSLPSGTWGNITAGPAEPNVYRMVVYFGFDEDTISQHDQKTLKDLAKTVTGNRERYSRLKVSGHTDSRGASSYNKELSVRRARSAEKILMEELVGKSGKIELSGFGESLPEADNSTSSGRAMNRRAEIVLVMKGLPVGEWGRIKAFFPEDNLYRVILRFNFDGSSMSPEDSRNLENILDGIVHYQDHITGISISGHTDSTGKASYNRILSRKRAILVRDMVLARFNTEHPEPVLNGFGEDLPVADNSTREGRALNRRTEIDCSFE